MVAGSFHEYVEWEGCYPIYSMFTAEKYFYPCCNRCVIADAEFGAFAPRINSQITISTYPNLVFWVAHGEWYIVRVKKTFPNLAYKRAEAPKCHLMGAF